MSVVVRTHGGLGNQIFQLFYARLYAESRNLELFEVHDARYEHGFTRSNALSFALRPNALQRGLSWLRVPKIATKVKWRRDAVRLIGTTYLDGYFQTMADYAAFDTPSLRRQLLRLRQELGVSPVPVHGHGMHLRLGDFFTSEAAVATHLDERLRRIDAGVGIVTNEEDRLASPEIASILTAAGARIIPTGDMAPEEVLRTLASFRSVDGNDSTLLFWASVLSGMACEYRNLELRGLRERFLRILES